MKTKIETAIDCVAMVRKERDRIARETEGLSAQEILAYFEKRRKKYQQNQGRSEERM